MTGRVGKEHGQQFRILAHPPAELTREPLRRLGEGIGKVVYASEHWVVRRERSASEILALILVWKTIRKVEHLLPGGLGRRLLSRPSRQIHILRIVMQALVIIVPRSLWFMTHIGDMWSIYRMRDKRGEALWKSHLSGTSLVPARVTFPPVRVRIGGWPGWLDVSEATERVEMTLYQRLEELAEAGNFQEVEVWLERLLDLRQSGWQRGVFSTDSHLKNYGVTGDRVVLIDSGGLTDYWPEVESRLSFEETSDEPHIQLGLGTILASRPDLAEHFDAQWKAIVNRDQVRSLWEEAQSQGHNSGSSG